MHVLNAQAFVEVEQLDGSESYKCEACKKCGPHTKRLQVWRPPRVLVVTLKRFAQRAAGSSIFSRFRWAAAAYRALFAGCSLLEHSAVHLPVNQAAQVNPSCHCWCELKVAEANINLLGLPSTES